MPQGDELVPEDVVEALLECEDQVDSLKKENKLLREASRTFGALAERLNETLESERRSLSDRRAAPRASGDRRHAVRPVDREPSHR